MTAEEIKKFIDCMTYEDNTVILDGQYYWCLGVTHSTKDEKCDIGVWRYDPDTLEFLDCLLDFTGNSTDECMKHFVEDRYWHGKSFYEVAPDMKWY